MFQALLFVAVTSIAMLAQGPFGFEKGMTRADVIRAVGSDQVDAKASKGDTVWAYSAPKPHPGFQEYAVRISPTTGAVKIAATRLRHLNQDEEYNCELHSVDRHRNSRFCKRSTG